FTTTSATRVLYSACEGQLDRNIWLLAAFATPVVMLTTIAGRHYPPPLSPVALRRLAFGVLMAIGVGLIATSLPPLLHRG
ncbi:hypothetical protein FH720_24830, partial [Bacteroides thetaiotaomicron]|nr:hypothetical protein [Bacteroides thetaiotaomicron]